MSNNKGLVYCYNKGCGKKFDPKQNEQDACIFHPGPPYFHDAYKIWKCCDKKSTDFSTWLEIKGCTKGKHSDEKPVEENAMKILTSKEIRPENPEKIIVWSGLNQATDRSKKLNEFIHLPIEIGPNAQRALEKFMKRLDLTDVMTDNNYIAKVGDSCKNNSCKMIYDGSKIMESDDHCLHHPGMPVFHEGIKYWSCCQKKTTDFTTFLDQVGCTRGSHCWIKPKSDSEKLREDWFQAYGLIHINIYCKGALPDKCLFQTNGLDLHVQIVYQYGEKESSLNYSLFGEILPAQSRAIINERKVEIVLKQADSENWPKLVYDGATTGELQNSDGEECYILGE